MPMRAPLSNAIADATYNGRACGQHGARAYSPLLQELHEIESWFDSESGGCSGDFLSAKTGRLCVGDDIVDPSVRVPSSSRRTLKRARVRCPRASKLVKRPVSIEERTLHFLMTVPSTASLLRVHEYSEKRFRLSGLSLMQLSMVLQAETGSRLAMGESDKTDVGDCKNTRVVGSVVDGVKDANGKGDVCPSDRSRVKTEEGGEGDALPDSVVGAGVARESGGDIDASLIDSNCVKREVDESTTLSFPGFVVGVPGEVDEEACAGPKVGGVVSLPCGSSGRSSALVSESNSGELPLYTHHCSRQENYQSLMQRSFQRVSVWLIENKRKPFRDSSREQNSIAQPWNTLCLRLQNGYSLPVNIADGLREFQKQVKEDLAWIASATAQSSAGKRSRVVASSSPADACTQRS